MGGGGWEGTTQRLGRVRDGESEKAKLDRFQRRPGAPAAAAPPRLRLPMAVGGRRACGEPGCISPPPGAPPSRRELLRTRPRSGRRAPGSRRAAAEQGARGPGGGEGARWGQRRHGQGVPPSVTWIPRATGVLLRGHRDATLTGQTPGHSWGAAVPRHAGAAPGQAGRRAYPASPAGDPLPRRAGRAGRGGRRRSRGKGAPSPPWACT